MTTETCAKCGTPTVTAHTWCLDEHRRGWRLCCLCTDRLIHDLDHDQDPACSTPPS